MHFRCVVRVGAHDRADKCTLWCESKEKVTSAILIIFFMNLLLKRAVSYSKLCELLTPGGCVHGGSLVSFVIVLFLP